MKSVMRIGLVIMLSMFVTGVFAQQRGQGGGQRNMDPEAQATQSLTTMKDIIKLDKKEEAKVKEIFLNSAKERQKMMQGMQQDGGREAMREKMTEMNEKRDKALKALLGEKRMGAYTKELEKRRAERGGRQRQN